MAAKKNTKSKITDYKTKRVELRMNQCEFWSNIGVTQSGGSRYEAGRNVPKPTQLVIDLAYGSIKDALQVLATLRGVTVDELICTPTK
jgi:predicted transcriptional regulator